MRRDLKLGFGAVKSRHKDILDDFNGLFQQILRTRMESLNDLCKAKTLLQFIKVKATQDKNYLGDLRDCINLHLLRIVEKIGFDSILEGT